MKRDKKPVDSAKCEAAARGPDAWQQSRKTKSEWADYTRQCQFICLCLKKFASEETSALALLDFPWAQGCSPTNGPQMFGRRLEQLEYLQCMPPASYCSSARTSKVSTTLLLSFAAPGDHCLLNKLSEDGRSKNN